LVLVESINKFVVTPDDASANVLTGDDDIDGTDEDSADIPTTRGDDEPLFDDAVPVEPTPDVRPDDDR
jgi:hypothetical protein